MINVEWRDPLEAGNCLSHIGNKNSGRYKKGSGERPWQHVPWRRKRRKEASKDLDDYINSPEFLNGKYSEYKAKKSSNESEITNKSSNELAIKKQKAESNDPNWRYADVKFKKPKPRLEEGTLVGEVQDSNEKKEKNNKKQEYIDVKPEKDKEEIPTVEYQQPSKEEKTKSREPMTSQDTAKAASYFKGASSLTGEVTKGVDKAWNSLHDLKYADEDRSKNVRGLTNEELRKTIERIKLDQEYNRITMPPKSKGYDRTMAALGALGSVLAVTATGLTIVAGAKKIKER